MVNTMVNLAGISFDHRMTEDTGSTVADVLRAFMAARRIVELDDQWDTIEALDRSVPLDTQINLFLEARRSTERAAGWLLRHRPPSFGIDVVVDEFAAPIETIAANLDRVVTGRIAADIDERRSRGIDAGVPAELAARAARWPWMHPGFDIVELARDQGCSIEHAMTAYWAVFDAFDLFWLWEAVGALPRSDRWQTQARSALRDDLLALLASLTRNVLATADGSPSEWIANNQRSVGKAIAMHTEIRRAESFDLTTLSVALRQLRNLTVLAR
jgi:glutamate dehydrogenase